jgi:hypothetical protein
LGADRAQTNDSIADDEFRRYQVEFIYRFTPRLNIRVEFARSDQQGVESSEFDYVENQARLFLRTEF